MQVDISYDCCEGLSTVPFFHATDTSSSIRCFPALYDQIAKIYLFYNDWELRKRAIEALLRNTELSLAEISKYAYFDDRFPYTRNLVSSDGLQFSLLLLCWNVGMESKVHDHPCDGCFVKALQGDIRETKYAVDSASNQLVASNDVVIRGGTVTYMDNSIGYHKVGNAGNIPAVTLHLYTPPYHSCKVWASPENYSNWFEGCVTYYSEYGAVNTNDNKSSSLEWYI